MDVKTKIDELHQLPELIETVLQLEPQIKELADKYYQI